MLKTIMRPLAAFFLLLLLSFDFIANAADSTNFDPRTVPVTAKSISGVPVGTVVAWPAVTNPSDVENWLDCNGQTISQAAYPELYAVTGGTVPDYQGMFLRGHGSQASTHYGSVTHSSGALGQAQGDAIRNITGTLTAGSWVGLSGNGAFTSVYGSGTVINAGVTSGATYYVQLQTAGIVPVANENRPVNKAVRYLIRAKP